MNTETKFTGGASVGWVNASWPLARLSVSSGQLQLWVALSGSYTFTPGQVVALELEGSIFRRGIRIVHTNPDYPEGIIFWRGGRDQMLQEIKRIGFQPRASAAQVPRRDGMAWRWSFVIVAVLSWNVLFLIDGSMWNDRHEPGLGGLTALALLFSATIALSFSTRFQSLAVKPGRSASEIQSMVRLLRLISGFLLVMFLVFALQRAG